MALASLAWRRLSSRISSAARTKSLHGVYYFFYDVKKLGIRLWSSAQPKVQVVCICWKRNINYGRRTADVYWGTENNAQSSVEDNVSNLEEDQDERHRYFVSLKRETALHFLELYKKDKSAIGDNELAHLAHSCIAEEDRAFTSQRPSVIGELSKRLPTLSHSYVNRVLKLCTNFDFSSRNKLALLCFEELVTRGSGTITKHIGVPVRTLAKLNLIDDRIKHIIEKSIVVCENLDIYDLSQLSWALTYVNHFPPSVAERLIGEMRRGQIQNCSYKALTSWLWCAGTATSVIPNDFVSELVDEALKRPFHDQLYNITAWSLGKRRQFCKQFFDSMAKEIALGNSRGWSPRLVTTFLWYVVSTFVYDKDTMDRLAESVLPALKSFTEHDLALLVRSFGTLNHPSPRLMGVVADELTRKIQSEFTSSGGKRNTRQSILTTVWSCLVGSVYPKDLIRHVMEVDSVEYVVNSGNYYAASVLLQLDLALRLERPDLELPTLPTRFTNQLVDICVRNSASIVVSSKFHCVVENALMELLGSSQYFLAEAHTLSPYRIDFELIVDDNRNPVIPPSGVWTTAGLPSLSSNSLGKLIDGLHRDTTTSSVKSFSGTVLPSTTTDGGRQSVSKDSPLCRPKELISAVTTVNLASDWSSTKLPKGQHRVAVEADGLYHYDQTSQHVLGKTLLKRRQLEAMGWKVLSIPYSEWSTFDKNSTAEQAQYIWTKLQSLEL